MGTVQVTAGARRPAPHGSQHQPIADAFHQAAQPVTIEQPKKSTWQKFQSALQSPVQTVQEAWRGKTNQPVQVLKTDFGSAPHGGAVRGAQGELAGSLVRQAPATHSKGIRDYLAQPAQAVQRAAGSAYQSLTTPSGPARYQPAVGEQLQKPQYSPVQKVLSPVQYFKDSRAYSKAKQEAAGQVEGIRAGVEGRQPRPETAVTPQAPTPPAKPIFFGPENRPTGYVEQPVLPTRRGGPQAPTPPMPPRTVDPRLTSNADIAVRRLAPRPSGLPLPQQDIAAPIAQPAAPVVSGRGPAPALPMSRPPARPAASVVEEPMISQQPPALPTSRPPARPTTPVAEESVASIRRQPVQDVPTPNVTETSRLNISAPLPGAKSTQDRVFDRSNPTTAGDLNVFSGNRTPITSDAQRSHGQAYQDLRSHMDQVQGQLAPGQMSILKKMASDPKATAADLDQLRNQLPPKPTQ